jgi:hypothetical protein
MWQMGFDILIIVGLADYLYEQTQEEKREHYGDYLSDYTVALIEHLDLSFEYLLLSSWIIAVWL